MTRWLLASLCMASPLGAAASGSAGTAGADFVKILASPRPAALGGAGVALGRDLGSLDLNPASLAGLDGFQAKAAHISWLESVALDHGALAWGQRQGSSFALSYLQMGTPEIEGLDVNGASLGTFKQSDRSIAVQLARPFGRMDLGLAVRSLQRELAGLSQSGFEGDVGVQLRLGNAWTLGLSALHLGQLSALESAADPTPSTYRAGVAWQQVLGDNVAAAFALDGVQPGDSSLQLRAGAELQLYRMLALRAGSQFSEAFDGRQAFTAGAGFQWQGLGVDYAWAPFGVLGNTHRVGLSWSGAERRAVKARHAPRPRAQWLKAQREGQGVVLSWDGSAAQKWALYLKKEARGELIQVAEVKGSQPKVRLKRFAANADVVFAVAPVDEEGRVGERSHQLVLAPGRNSLQVHAPPNAPRNLRVTKNAEGARLRWDAPLDNEGRLLYQAYSSTRNDGGFQPLGSLNSLSERTLDLSAQKRRLYFSVRARRAEDDALLSDWTPTVSAEP